MNRRLAGALAVLVVALVVWRLSRRGAPQPNADESVASERSPSPAAAAPRASRKAPVPVFDERPALRAQIDELLKEKEARKREQEQRCVGSVTSDCPFLTPSQDVLREMARCAVVKADMPLPPVDPADQDPATPPEVAEVNRQFWREKGNQLRSLHLELTGKTVAPETSSLLEEIQRAIPGDASEAIQRTVARERAGLAAAPRPPDLASKPAAERYWRLRLSLGDDYEAALAHKLGAERARTMRAERDGWASKAVFAGQCDP